MFALLISILFSVLSQYSYTGDIKIYAHKFVRQDVCDGGNAAAANEPKTTMNVKEKGILCFSSLCVCVCGKRWIENDKVKN